MTELRGVMPRSVIAITGTQLRQGCSEYRWIRRHDRPVAS
jgi:hypothetical protein